MVKPQNRRQGRARLVPEREQGLWRRRQGRRRCQPRCRDRQALHPARPLRLRQDHDAADDRGPRDGHVGQHPDRRQGRDRPARDRSRRLDGVPVLRAFPAHDRPPERLLRSRILRLQESRGGRAGDGRAGTGRPERIRRPPAERAVRRPAAACRRRPRARSRTAGAALRRAAVQSRRQTPPPGPRGDPRDPAELSG